MEKSIEQAFDWLDVRQAASRKTFVAGRETHVWTESLNIDGDFYSLLSKEEQKTASRYRFYEDQQHYIVSHGILRRLLGEYLNTDAASLTLTETKYGKPLLLDATGKQQIYFNMTHSRNIACYAFSLGCEVGIDMEFVDPTFNWYSIAKLYFTAEEVIYLTNLDKCRQVKAFYTLWTKKESILKAKGTGLSDIKKVNNQNFASDFFVIPYSQLSYQGHLAVHGGASIVHFFSLEKSNQNAEWQEETE